MKKLILMLMLCAPMTMMAQKFGKVNTQQIMQSLPDVAKANGEMEALQKQKENELKSMQDELQRKADEYQKGASTMNATAKQQKETELQTLQQKIQQALFFFNYYSLFVKARLWARLATIHTSWRMALLSIPAPTWWM